MNNCIVTSGTSVLQELYSSYGACHALAWPCGNSLARAAVNSAQHSTLVASCVGATGAYITSNQYPSKANESHARQKSAAPDVAVYSNHFEASGAVRDC